MINGFIKVLPSTRDNYNSVYAKSVNDIVFCAVIPNNSLVDPFFSHFIKFIAEKYTPKILDKMWGDIRRAVNQKCNYLRKKSKEQHRRIFFFRMQYFTEGELSLAQHLFHIYWGACSVFFLVFDQRQNNFILLLKWMIVNSGKCCSTCFSRVITKNEIIVQVHLTSYAKYLHLTAKKFIQ